MKPFPAAEVTQSCPSRPKKLPQSTPRIKFVKALPKVPPEPSQKLSQSSLKSSPMQKPLSQKLSQLSTGLSRIPRAVDSPCFRTRDQRFASILLQTAANSRIAPMSLLREALKRIKPDFTFPDELTVNVLKQIFRQRGLPEEFAQQIQYDINDLN